MRKRISNKFKTWKQIGKALAKNLGRNVLREVNDARYKGKV